MNSKEKGKERIDGKEKGDDIKYREDFQFE